MAPLSFPVSSLLKGRDCLQRAGVLFNVLNGLPHRPSKPRSWKRGFCAASYGMGQILSQQRRVKTHGASVRSSSSAGQDMAERLWTVYNETKRQTEGTTSSTSLPSTAVADMCCKEQNTHSTTSYRQPTGSRCDTLLSGREPSKTERRILTFQALSSVMDGEWDSFGSW